MSETFTPVPVRARRDGWTPARQQALIAALRETRCVVAACRQVSMSWQSAYQLRARPDAASFAAAWDAALVPPPRPAGRAIGGIATPIRYRGRQIGERRRYDNRLATYLLSIRRPEIYGARACPREGPDEIDEMFADLDQELFDATPAAHTSSPRKRGPITRTHHEHRADEDAARDHAPPAEPPSRADVARTSSISAPRPPPRLHRRPATIEPDHAHRRHPALRSRQHLRPHPARRDPVEARVRGRLGDRVP